MIVLVKIMEVEKHPNPKVEKLIVTKVMPVGLEGLLQVVTNDKNLEVGDHVMLTMTGHVFSDGDEKFEITQRDVMGVDSFGMFCGAKELGIPEVSKGVVVIAKDKI